jgi:hypothetical protein
MVLILLQQAWFEEADTGPACLKILLLDLLRGSAIVPLAISPPGKPLRGYPHPNFMVFVQKTGKQIAVILWFPQATLRKLFISGLFSTPVRYRTCLSTKIDVVTT